MADMFYNVSVSVLHVFDIESNINHHTVSQSPAIMHMLDKSGSCGKFDNYQRPEGFPVGTYITVNSFEDTFDTCTALLIILISQNIFPRS